MKRTYLSIIAIALIAAACTNMNNNEFGVSGTIANAEGMNAVLIGFDGGTPDTLANVALGSNGEFSMPLERARLNFYTLQVGTAKPIVLAFDSLANVNLTADFNTIEKTYEVSGSPDSEAIRDYFVAATGYEVKLDSLMSLMQTLASQGADLDTRNEVSKQYRALQEEYRNYKVSIVEKDPSNAVNFSVLQTLNLRDDLPLFIKVRDGLANRMQGNAFFDNLAEAVAKQEKAAQLESLLSAGSPAPEISLPDPSGKVVNLSSLRGNYVLIDFWASWCKPCRVENPNVVKMYDRYKNKNFEIYSVSLDRDRGQWEQAIAADGLKWVHVSDLQFWQSAAAQLYNVQSIPFTVLVDPDGNIVDTNLRGQALESKLAQIFGA